jgi:exopolysaccharide biosynthesis polyprenyl glycosylphosphotransferase
MASQRLLAPVPAAVAVTRERTGAPGPALAATLVARSYRGSDYYLRRLLALGDIVAIVLALMAAPTVTSGDPDHHLLIGMAMLPVWLVVFKCYRLYESDAKRLAHTTIDDIPGLFHAVLLGGVLTWLYFRVTPGGKLTFITLLLFSALALGVCLVTRFTTRAAIKRMFAPERLLLIGTSDATRMLAERLQAARCHVQIVAVLTAREHEGEHVVQAPLGRLDLANLTHTLRERRIGRVVITNRDLGEDDLTEMLRGCRSLSVKVSLVPGAFGVMGPSVEVEDIRGLTLFDINPPVLPRSSRWAKRGFDVIGAALALLACSPLLAVLALLVRLDSPGPVLFRQDRIGQNGRRVKLLKLRTMEKEAERRRAELLAQSKDPGWLHLEHDPRITRIGRLLRLTSLDELPQLWNVLRGEMSLVGPRPLVPEEDTMVQAWARGRLDLTPGITGLWQVLGRTSIPFEEMVKLDYLYVTNWSLWGDVRLMLRTLPVVLRGSGAN